MSALSTSAYYDAVIAGGGMVGVTLALAMAQRMPEWRIAVVDRFAPPTEDASVAPSISFDGRSTVISEGSRRLLTALHLWEPMASYAAPICHIHVSERKGFGHVNLSAQERGWDALGYVIENKQLGRALFRALKAYPCIEFIGGANVTAIQPLAEYSTVMLARDQATTMLRAGLVVVADGVGSALRESLGMSSSTHDYQQVGIIANVGFSQPHQGYAYERFTDWGPMALLPLLNAEGMHRAALIWTMDEQRAAELLSASEAEFLSILQARFGYRQGRFLKVGERHQHALRLDVAAEQVRHRLVILGNAAHTLHPVAGQGFNLSLRDVATLVDVLVEAQAQQRSIGDLAVLQAYLDRRRIDQRNTIQFSHQLTALFAQENPMIQHGRRLGLIGLDNLLGLKTWFTDLAAGTGVTDR